jgi:hypothetical protein
MRRVESSCEGGAKEVEVEVTLSSAVGDAVATTCREAERAPLAMPAAKWRRTNHGRG